MRKHGYSIRAPHVTFMDSDDIRDWSPQEIIRNYIRGLENAAMLKTSKKYGEYFDFRNCSIWAATEVLRYVKQHSEIHPLISIEDFARKMDAYSCIDRKTSMIFSIAHDVAEDILDIFLTIYD